MRKIDIDHFLVNLMTATSACGLEPILFTFPTRFSTGDVEKTALMPSAVVGQQGVDLADDQDDAGALRVV